MAVAIERYSGWTPRSMRLGRGSQTPGKSKGPSCQADKMKKFFAKSARSYKHRQYPQWCAKMDNLNYSKKGG